MAACDKENYQNQIQAIFNMNDDALVEERVVDMVEYNQACMIVDGEIVLSAIERPMSKSEFYRLMINTTQHKRVSKPIE